MPFIVRVRIRWPPNLRGTDEWERKKCRQINTIKEYTTVALIGIYRK